MDSLLTSKTEEMITVNACGATLSTECKISWLNDAKDKQLMLPAYENSGDCLPVHCDDGSAVSKLNSETDVSCIESITDFSLRLVLRNLQFIASRM